MGACKSAGRVEPRSVLKCMGGREAWLVGGGGLGGAAGRCLLAARVLNGHVSANGHLYWIAVVPGVTVKVESSQTSRY